MKLKYYLRGLGIGVLVTTIILAIALNNKPMELTDAQIKERAAELGMVEKETVQNPEKEEQSEITTTQTTTATATTKTTQATTQATTKATETTTQAAEATTQAQQAANNVPDGTIIEIEIGTYDWSNHVAKKFEEAGLVESASDFDQYLINHGYETRIRSGKHDFIMGSSYEELAKELVSSPK